MGVDKMNCDICGKQGELYNIEMEGSRLVACSNCAAYGKKLNKVSSNQPVQKKSQANKSTNYSSNTFVETKAYRAEESVIILVDNYHNLIKNKRERLGLKQEELAKAINEKESLIQHIETKKIEPTTKVAEKLESFLKIKILELYKPPVIADSENKPSGPLTLGDMMQIKKRKKK